MTTNDSISAHAILPSPLELRAADGFTLGARLFEPEGAPRANLVVHAATAAPQTYYEPFAMHMAALGIRVVTYDYRGVGASRPESLRGFDATMTDWATLDARAALAYVRERYGDVPTFFVGHSFGGQMIGLLDELREVEGAILVASQLGYFGHWAPLERLRLAAVWYAVVPLITGAFGYLPGKGLLGVELPSGVAREWARWCRHPHYLIGHVAEAEARFARFDRPFLHYSFTDDEFAPGGAVDALLEVLPSSRRTHRRIAPAELGVRSIGHFGFFRPKVGMKLWGEVAHFIDAVLEGRRPGLPDTPPRASLGSLIRLEWSDLVADLEAGRV
jgi:predicted alpha/beta hydrolase